MIVCFIAPVFFYEFLKNYKITAKFSGISSFRTVEFESGDGSREARMAVYFTSQTESLQVSQQK